MLTAASGTGAARAPVHKAVTHAGRPVVHHATLTAAFKPAAPRARPKPRKAAPKKPAAKKFGAVGIAKTPFRATVPHAPKGPVSPYVNPFARSGGVVGQRIDQGVDYTGHPGAPIGALGPGRIVQAQASGSGWPGGGFIGEQLTAGPAKGQVVFTAEDVAPLVRTGQTVKAGQPIGVFTSGGSIESGWGTLPPNTGQALAYGKESAPGSDPGAYSTGFGIDFNKIITALGGPRGVLQGVQNRTPASSSPIFSATGGKAVPQPSKGHVSLPPAVPPTSGVHGVNPPSTRPMVPVGPVELTAHVTPIKRVRNPIPKFRKPVPTIQPKWPPVTPPQPKPGPAPGPAPSVTTITSSKGKGNALGAGQAAPATSGSMTGGGTLLIVAGVGIVLLLVFMNKKGKKGKGSRPRK